jgi:inosine-uridine nucleoside N-ribohydrolase
MGATLLAATTLLGTGASIVQADDQARRQKHAAEKQAELIAEEANRTREEAIQAAKAAQDQQANLQAREAAAALAKDQELKSSKEAQVVVDVASPASGETTAKRRARFQVVETPETSVRI